MENREQQKQRNTHEGNKGQANDGYGDRLFVKLGPSTVIQARSLVGILSASVVTSAPVSRPSFPYADELSYLRAMGFVDNALNKYLLLNNKGDLQQVVQWLLANAKA